MTRAILVVLALMAGSPAPAQSVAPRNLRAFAGEQSYEFVIGMFSKLKSADHQKQQKIMQHMLGLLKQNRQEVIARLAEKEAEIGGEELGDAVAQRKRGQTYFRLFEDCARMPDPMQCFRTEIRKPGPVQS